MLCWIKRLKNLTGNFRIFHPNHNARQFSNESDLSSNYLSTFHKDSFRGLKHLHVLDLSVNTLEYLPPHLFADLENLVKLFASDTIIS